jgi:hypothetical protein
MQRAQTPPESIVFHNQQDPGDEHTLDGGAGADEGSRFQERLAKSVKIFEAYKDGRTFIDRVNLSILRTMCQDRGLATNGYKIDLLTRLKEWVSRVPH